jgi:hypothetical protein
MNDLTASFAKEYKGISFSCHASPEARLFKVFCAVLLTQKIKHNFENIG